MKPKFRFNAIVLNCLIALLIPAPGILAQIPDTPELSFQKGKLYLNDSALKAYDAANYLPAPLAEQYVRALDTELTGNLLMGLGGTVTLASGITWALESAKFRKSDSDLVPAALSYAIIGTAAGVLVCTGGWITYLVGRNKVKRIYEKQSAGTNSQIIELTLGYSSNGIGLALNF